jgi:hypothetical protein
MPLAVSYVRLRARVRARGREQQQQIGKKSNHRLTKY